MDSLMSTQARGDVESTVVIGRGFKVEEEKKKRKEKFRSGAMDKSVTAEDIDQGGTVDARR